MLIAAQLAITPETFSRTLRVLSEESLIRVVDDEVTILDIEMLRQHMR
jgi:DNA-binding MarR family transcriptional regulator